MERNEVPESLSQMKKPKGKIDWSITEDDEAWRASLAAAHGEPLQKALHQRETVLAVLIALLFLFLIGRWFWPHHEPVRGTSNPPQGSVVQEEDSLTNILELS